MKEESPTENPGGQIPSDIRPGELRLHVNRPPVTRLSRKVLIGLGASVLVAIAGALFFSVRPMVKTPAPELLDTGNHTIPEGLTRLSRAHLADAPRLGPPLPGDLGKPMLKAGVGAPAVTATSIQTPDQQRIAQERDAARSSHLFATAPPSLNNAATPSSGEARPAQQALPVQSAADPTATQNMQDRKAAFLKDTSDNPGVSLTRIEKIASPYVVQAGWIIAGALVSGINSDLPGEIIAQVTEDVWDSPSGKYLLIPHGSKLLGKFSSQVSFGQRRVQIVWTRITFPNGNWIALQNLPGSDVAGHSGLEDEVDNHWGAVFKAAILSTILSIGAEAGTSDSENNLAQAIRQGASQSISQTGQHIVERTVNIQPTLTIRPGYPLRIIVERDLVLAPYSNAVP